MAKQADDDEVMAQVAARLTERFPDVDAETIREVVAEEFDALSGRPVRDYLSVLTERAAKKRLKRQ